MGIQINKECVKEELYEMGLRTAIDVSAGVVTSTLAFSPLCYRGGAAMGMISALVDKVVYEIVERVIPDTDAGLVAKLVSSIAIKFFTITGLTMGISSLMGRSISFQSAALFTGSMLVISGGILVLLLQCVQKLRPESLAN